MSLVIRRQNRVRVLKTVRQPGRCVVVRGDVKLARVKAGPRGDCYEVWTPRGAVLLLPGEAEEVTL